MATINLSLLENRNIIAQIDGIPLAQENSYKIIAGETNATKFKIVSKPEPYADYTYTVEMVNARGFGISETDIIDSSFVLPIGMAVAGYGYILIKAKKGEEIIPFTVLKVKIWNTIPKWTEGISDGYVSKIENGYLYILRPEGFWEKTEIVKVDIAQSTGTSTTMVMSQKATTDAINEIWDEINYVKPTIASFSLTPTLTYIKLNTTTTYTLTSITHKETNIGNINGTLTLKRGSTTLKSNISPTTSSSTITVSDTITLSTSETQYVLSCISKKNETISATVTVRGYWTSFIGASTSSTVSDSVIKSLTDTNSMSLSGTRTITTTAGQYVWFISTNTINKVTSSGFDVPITLVNSSYSYQNGTYKCYRSSSALTAGTHTFVMS